MNISRTLFHIIRNMDSKWTNINLCLSSFLNKFQNINTKKKYVGLCNTLLRSDTYRWFFAGPLLYYLCSIFFLKIIFHHSLWTSNRGTPFTKCYASRSIHQGCVYKLKRLCVWLTTRFSLNWPLGPFSLQVGMVVYVNVCPLYEIVIYIFWSDLFVVYIS